MNTELLRQVDWDAPFRDYITACAKALEKIVGSELSLEDTLALAHVVYEKNIEMESGLIINPLVDSERELGKWSAALLSGTLSKVKMAPSEWYTAYLNVGLDRREFIERYHLMLGMVTAHHSVRSVS